MTEDQSSAWPDEIRSYLIGRLSHSTVVGTIPKPTPTRLTPPILRWWIFEGKRYEGIEGPLTNAWGEVARQVLKLLATFNPRLRISDHPDGQVDWPRTLSRGAADLSEYVTLSSGVGLSEAEARALMGWAGWIAGQWEQYTRRVSLPNVAQFQAFHAIISGQTPMETPSPEQLRSWAHTTRRSRWLFLRAVVAETLRCVLEPTELDRLPLPSDRATLFELLCLVRIARAIAPEPGDIRWLDLEASNNTVVIPGASLRFQCCLPRQAIRGTLTDPGLREAVEKFPIRLPERMDIFCEFQSKPLAGMIVEAKSGSQQPGDGLAQLRTYRAAIPRRPGSRYLIWAVAENPSWGTLRPDQLAWIGEQVSSGTEDVWVLSGADDIAAVLAAGLVQQLTGTEDHV